MKCMFNIYAVLKILLLIILFLYPVSPVDAEDTTARPVDHTVGKGISSQIQLTEQEQAWLKQRHTVRVRINDFPPHMMTLPEPRGIAVDYLKLIGKHFGINFKFVVAADIPWKESVEDLEGDRTWFDLLITMKRTPEREKKIAFTQDYLFAPWVIVNRTNSPYVSRIEDLNGRSVAVERGYVIEGLIKEKFPQVRIVTTKNTLEALNSVAGGFSDAYVGNLTVASYLIQNGGLHNLKIAAPTPFGNHDQAMGVRSDWPELVSIINKALVAMPEAEKSEITSRWFAVKYEHGINMRKVLSWIGAICATFTLVIVATVIWNRRLKREIDRRMAAEDELTKKERKFRALFEHSQDAVFITIPDGQILSANPAASKMFGMTEQEMCRLGRAGIIDANDSLLVPALEERKRSGQIFTELTCIRKNGEKFQAEVSSVITSTEPPLAFVIIHDISERKRAEAALRESEERYRTFAHLTSDFVYRCQRSSAEPFRLKWLGGAVEKITGYTEDEIFATGCWLPLVHPDDRPHISDMLLGLVPGDTINNEFRIMAKSGEVRWLLESLLCEAGDAPGLLVLHGASRDITDRKQAEEDRKNLEKQLHQAQKMESLGVLAGGIAHDFNNILAVIMCYSSLGQQKPEKAADLMPEIETAAQRAAALCRQMLAYAGKTQFVQSQVDMTALLDDTLGMLKATLPQNVSIKPYLTGDLPSITGDGSQLRQIAVNLVINASEAIGEEQGDIRVALTKATIRDEQKEKDYTGTDITPGTYLCLEVSDTGCGMDDETKSRIFEPFFTTKFVGRGLGMSAVLGVVISHNGALQLQSTPGQGTTFKIYLPVRQSESVTEPSLTNVPAAWEGGGTILLVEDEPQLITVARNLLETLGFFVIEALNGAEALEQYRRNAADIRLVLTDIGMPLMNGYQLIRELKKLNPNLPIIVSSGFGDTIVTTRIAPGDIAGLISKPYNFDQLREVLKGVMENSK